MSGSSYIPIVVPIVAFIAMACWLGLVFYADSHPGYGRRKSREPSRPIAPDQAAGQLPVDELAELPSSAGASSPSRERQQEPIGEEVLTGHAA